MATAQNEEPLNEALETLKILEEESNIPKNVKAKVQEIIQTLDQETETFIKTNKALDELDEISNNPSIDQHIRTQVWNIVSLLEKVNGQ